MEQQKAITGKVLGVVIALALVAGFFLYNSYFNSQKQVGGVTVAESGYTNATYTIEGVPVLLVNGVSEVAAAPGSVSKVTTKVFGNEALGDVNNDGVSDVAFLITQNKGGSGTFYYVVAALKTPAGYQGTNAVLLGDRIAPQTTRIENGEIIVNYADRNQGEPMTTKPSLGKSMYVVVKGTTLMQSPRVVGVGEHCGGNMTTAPVCAEGYHCAPTPGSHLPFGDVGGTCVAN